MFPTRFLVSRGTLDTAMSARLSCTGLSPSLAGFPKTFPLNSLNQFRGPNPGMHARRFGLFPFSLAATLEITCCFLFLWLLRCFSSPGSDVWLCIHHTTTEVCSARFPHSEISGSKCICHSPKLFAAYHVFHRLLVPRHPPCALSKLNQLYHSYSVMNVGSGFVAFTNILGFISGCLVSFCVIKILVFFYMRFQGTI